MKNSVRIGFVYDVRVMMRANMKLVKRALVHSRNKSFPNTRIATCLQLVRLPVPSVEAANHRNFTRIGRPHGERRALRSEEHTSELQSQSNLVCRLLLEKKKNIA